PGTGKTYMAKKMAEELTNSRDDYKIIQFHPSYTYEDFVRGISAESNNGEVIYETKNKVFAEFAEKASKNLIDSKKKAEVFSKEEAIRKVIDLYTDDFVESDKPHYQLSGTRLVDIHDGKFIYKIKKGGDHKFSISIDEVTIGLLNNVSDYDSVKELNISQSTKSKYRSFMNICDAIYKEYENKIEGIRNNLGVGAIESPERRNFVLIIDEINRANLPSVLGELIYGLEYRGEPVESMYALEGEREIIIPENLYIIGTMNTADRSVGHIDYAIRRRFAFEDVLPNSSVIALPEAQALFNEVEKLFKKEGTKENAEFLASDFDYKDVQLGHSYFMAKNVKELEMKLKYEIKPILREYVKDGLLLE
ncbi:MAG: AAA family ATPase, partial [Pseudomonadales bacterium]|nr:AAA family ATPase [Pseudomonadales bacterium]